MSPLKRPGIVIQTIITLVTVLSLFGSSVSANAQQMIPPDPGVVGVVAGPGTLLVAGTNTPFLPRGFVSLGVLYPTMYAQSMCGTTTPPGQPAAMNLEAAQDRWTGDPSGQLSAMKSIWDLNTVRFHVSQGALQFEYGLTQAGTANTVATPYTDMVREVIAEARAADLIVIIDMQTEVYSCTALRADGNTQKLPDFSTEQAWAQLLNSSLTHDRGVILEIFNEPNTQTECNLSANYNYTQWATGCGVSSPVPADTASSSGMLTVGAYLRQLAPLNVLIFDADNDAGAFYCNAGRTDCFCDPSGENCFLVPSGGMPANSAYAVHPFFYVLASGNPPRPDPVKSQANWDDRFGDFEQAGNTVMATAWNASLNCPTEKYPNDVAEVKAITRTLVTSYLPAHGIGLIAEGWDAPQANAGYLVDSYLSPTFRPINMNSQCDYTGASLVQTQFQME